MSPQNLIQILQSLPPQTPIALDYETEIPGKGGSVEYYRRDFRVASIALAWTLDGINYTSEFLQGETAVKSVLTELQERNFPIVVHNLMFEYGVTKCRAGHDLDWTADTMRMVQVADNGGKNADIEEELSIDDEIAILEGKKTVDTNPRLKGLSLQASVKRWLPTEFHNHKKPFHDYLINHIGCKEHEVGQNLNKLPSEMLKKYNCLDAEVTLRLFYVLSDYFKQVEYDYRPDHDLYIEMCKLTALSKIKGVKIDRNYLIDSCLHFERNVEATKIALANKLKDYIPILEEKNKQKILSGYKTEKGREAAICRLNDDPSTYQFNINSTPQKTCLFQDIMGIKPKFFTKKGAPSFKRTVLGQWGEAGLLLAKRGTELIALKQCEKLLEKSSYDGRWHIDISPAGTTTGRMKGGGGLNVQAMSRREPKLMEGIIADPGKVFVSIDLSAGEPSITAHFSKDSYYNQAIFGMVGKRPYYDSQGVLLIDDIYLMGMSVSPMGKDKLRRAFNELYNGLSFADAWMSDKELVLKELKKERAFHKILILGIGYAMGPKKMVESAFQAGYDLSLKDAKAFFKAYWELFSGVKQLSKVLEYKLQQEKALVNTFGYRLIPDKTYKAFNYFIQSSVNGIINVLCVKFFSICPEAEFISIIHDEIIIQIPKEKAVSVQFAFKQALESLNQDLNWRVAIRTGWAEGKDFYAAK